MVMSVPLRSYVEPVEVLFSGELWYWRGPAPFHFVSVPDAQCAELEAVSPLVSYGWGMVPVEAQVGRTTWRTSLFPKNGGYIVPIKDSVRRAESLDVGDVIGLRLSVAQI
jgi:hypothetical protein